MQRRLFVLPTLFDVCTPREDVLQGNLSDADFAADLASVLRGQAVREYQDPVAFFANTHPTRGLRNLLSNICLRLTGDMDQITAIYRLDTNFGGGKTHALIALSHVARGVRQVPNINEFLKPNLLPREPVRVAAFDGENADPVNGHALGDGICAYTPWGELAYALGGVEGYKRIQNSDTTRIAPGSDTLRELIAGKPALILLDELSVYLRKQTGTGQLKMAAGQLTAFLTALFKAVESSPRTALVYTLAIGKKDQKATDAYSQENQVIADMMLEAESVSARKATLLDPTEEDETVKVLRRRLFAHIDEQGAHRIIQAYARLWDVNREALPSFGLADKRLEEFEAGFPLHPELIATLKEKTSTLNNFQRVRGMLRLLARTVCRLWRNRPAHTCAVHLHHIDLTFSPIRQEITTKLGQSAFVPALKADIAAVEGDAPSLAEQMDASVYAGLCPYASCVARTIFFHTLAFNDNLKGADPSEICYAILAPDLDISFVTDAIRRFRQESAFMDDHPNKPLRFLAEPNLTQIIHQQERRINPQDVRSRLNDTIRELFKGRDFQPVAFPGLPNEVADSSDKPLLVILGYEAVSLDGSALTPAVPDLVCRLYKYRNNDGTARINRNNLVFIVADTGKVEEMKGLMRHRLALEDLQDPALQQDLAPHQQAQLKERYQKSRQELAIGIQQAYRHLFYPTNTVQQNGQNVTLAHTSIDLPNTAANPGSGQAHIIRILESLGKLHRDEKQAYDTPYLVNKTPLKQGFISTIELYNEYRRNTGFALLANDSVLKKAITNGINSGDLVYKKGDLIWGKGDPLAEIEFSDQAQILTSKYAGENKIWPRPAPDTTGNSGGGNGDGNGDGQKDDKHDPKPPLPPAPVLQVTAEGVLNETLTRIWEDAQAEKISAISHMEIATYEASDAQTLARIAATVAGCEKFLNIEIYYETRNQSSCSFSFEGGMQDAQQLLQFLLPQLRAASGKSFTMKIILNFSEKMLLSRTSTEAFNARFKNISLNGKISMTVRQAQGGE